MSYEDEQLAMYCTCSFTRESKRRCEMHGMAQKLADSTGESDMERYEHDQQAGQAQAEGEAQGYADYEASHD